MYKHSCPREPVYFFMRSLYLATTMYERSCQRGPVYYFYYVFLASHDHE